MVIDLAFDEQGNLYVLQFATGALQQTGAGDPCSDQAGYERAG
jgi:hypothetical protein